MSWQDRLVHAARARVAACVQFLLRIRTSKILVVPWFAPVRRARPRTVSILNVETTGITYIPVVVNLHEVRLERAGCICSSSGATSSSLDVISKCCTAPAAVRLAAVPPTPSIASVSTALLETPGLCYRATPPLLITTRLGDASSLISALLGYASACVRCKRWDM